MYRPPIPRNTDRVSVGRGSVGRHHAGYHDILEGMSWARIDKEILPYWLDAKDLHARGQLSEAEFTQCRLSAEWLLMQMAGREPTFDMPEGLRGLGSVSGAYRRARTPALRSIGRASSPAKAPKKATAKKKSPKTNVCYSCNARNVKSAAYCHKCGAKFVAGRSMPKVPKSVKKRKAHAKSKACTHCKVRNPKSAAYCKKCGESFSLAGPSVRGAGFGRHPVSPPSTYRLPALPPAREIPMYRSPLQLESFEDRIHEVPSAPKRRR